MSGTFGANSGFISNSNGRQMGSYFNGSSNRLSSSIGYLGYDSGSMLSSMSRNFNAGVNYPINPTNMSAFAALGNGGGVNYMGLPSIAPELAQLGNISSLGSGNFSRGAGVNNLSLPSGSYGRSNSTGTIGEPFSASGNAYEVNNPDTYGNSSIYGGTSWRFPSSEVDVPSFSHDLGNVDPNMKSDISANYMGNYSVSNNQPSRGQLSFHHFYLYYTDFCFCKKGTMILKCVSSLNGWGQEWEAQFLFLV
jgi:RNA-binding protein Musashi